MNYFIFWKKQIFILNDFKIYLRLLTIINAIADTIKGKLPSFEAYLKAFAEANNFRENFFSGAHNAATTENQSLLNKKVKRSKFNLNKKQFKLKKNDFNRFQNLKFSKYFFYKDF